MNEGISLAQTRVKVGEVDDSIVGADNPNMDKMMLMLVITLLFVAAWIFIGLAVALYVRACTEDDSLKNSHAT